ncbi:AAA family ATPase [Chitinophaga sp. SYP-B3965]|uniref:AAA family ATPase n=1 Tax=Chitinophaga sp. SYP-B3965 TaxID=2663120 RepID=UPI0013BB6751|nr:AAA family ATPase [Chitinophaga sp. SYP-B3965]
MKKIVVIGPESTGKSTLSSQLAAHYKTLWVPEFARDYLMQLNRPYEQEDLLRMAEGQLITEDAAAVKANELLICDTDLQVIKVWSEAKYGDCDPRILEMIASRKYDLYLLTYIDIAWEDDPLREHPKPEERQYFYQIYRDIVMNSGLPWADIRGGYEERLQTAIEAVTSL